MSKSGLIKSTGVIGMATAISRVLGFVRDIVIAGYFGTGLAAQAFVVAFRIPNSLRDLVGEGAANAAIVPVLTEYKTLKGEEEFLHISRVLLNISFVVLLSLAALGVIFSPFIVRLIAPGFISEPAKLALTIKLNRIIFPYLILIGLTAYSMGVLNTFKHFESPAFGPALFNLALILSTVWLYSRIGVIGLAIGVLAGGALQLALTVPFIYKRGISLSFKDGFYHMAVKRIGRLLLPRAMGSAVYQINIFVDTILASLEWIVGSGGVAALFFANRLIQFPLAIFGLALAQAALPKMSQEYAMNDIERLKDTLSFYLRVAFLIMLPASFGLAILGGPIIKVLFERGEFTSYSTAITQNALFFYSFGLFAYAGIKLLVTCFYSMHDTMTPVKTAFVSTILNIILNLVLMWPLKLGGLALATSISASFNFFILYLLLKKKIGSLGTIGIVNSFVRTLLASIVMGGVLKVLLKNMNGQSFASLFVCISTAIAVFIVASYAFNVKEARKNLVWITKRK